MHKSSDPSPEYMVKTQFETAPTQVGIPGPIRKMVNVWLYLAGPKRASFGSSMEELERLRHSRLLSALLFCGIVVLLMVVPTAIPVPTYWIPIFLNLSLSAVALFLNRSGRINIASIFYILAIDATLVVLMVTLPTGIRNSNIPDFDLFFLPVLISGVVLPKRFIPLIAIMHIIVIVTLFSLLPHDRLLTEEIQINQGGFAYSELSDAFILQVVGGAIAWLSAWSVDRALLRASKAEDLAEARRHLNKQASRIVEQKQRLEYGIDVVKNAQARFANGDFKARARLQDNELVPLAMSFNLLAERLNRINQMAHDYTRLEQALQRLLEDQNAILYGGTVKQHRPSGTLVDRIQPIIQRYDQLRSIVIQSRMALETIWRDLAQQQVLVSELDAVLTQASSTALFLASYSGAQRPEHAPSQGTAVPDPFSLLPMIGNSPQVSAYFDDQVQLLGRAQQLCAQLNKQSRQSLQTTKDLVSQLPSPAVLLNTTSAPRAEASEL